MYPSGVSVNTVDLQRPDHPICKWPNHCKQCPHLATCLVQNLAVENEILKEEIRVSRESAEITASLVVKQFEETDRVLARLQEANAQRKAVLDSATHMAIVATDKHGVITLFNKGAERLLGYTSEEVIGRATPLIYHDPADLKIKSIAISDSISKYIGDVDLLFQYANQPQSEHEWTVVRKDGTTLPVTMSINPLGDADGHLSGFLGMAADITEKKTLGTGLKRE